MVKAVANKEAVGDSETEVVHLGSVFLALRLVDKGGKTKGRWPSLLEFVEVVVKGMARVDNIFHHDNVPAGDGC